jgi:hypothetical protein
MTTEESRSPKTAGSASALPKFENLGVGKYEKREGRKINRNQVRGSLNAWCYVCASEHRYESPCLRRAS